jgi:hypothetical protein
MAEFHRIAEVNGEGFMKAEVRAGAADTYAGTVPAGQIGLWCASSSDNSFDNFKAQDIAGPFEADGRWFCNRGQVRADNADNNVVEAYATDGGEDCLVRRGFRGDKFVATFKFKWNADVSPGFLVRWLSPGDYLAIAIGASDGKTRLYKRQDDGTLSTLATAGTALNLTSGTWYEGKVVIDDDPGNSALQQLRFWVDSDRDGNYADETTLITTTAVDDAWSGGYAGLYRTGGSSLQQFDDVQIGYDNNGDGDILDAGDELQVDDDFSTNVITLSYDNNGNLTDDGVLKFGYDAWNRLAQATRRVDAQTVIGTYHYLGNTWRASKVVTNCGPEAVANDGGNTTVNFYYSQRWQILEMRNGSGQASRQFVYGTQYVDEPLLTDVNEDPGTDNYCDPDTDSGDRRYVYAQDRNWNVVALLETDDGAGAAGAVAERYAYTPYGELSVIEGDGSGAIGHLQPTSQIGNTFFHQGLFFDPDVKTYSQRHRMYCALLLCFAQRDVVTRDGAWLKLYADGMSAYGYLRQIPNLLVDPMGLESCCEKKANPCAGTGDAEQKCCACLIYGENRGTPECADKTKHVLCNRQELGKTYPWRRWAGDTGFCAQAASTEWGGGTRSGNYKKCCCGTYPAGEAGEIMTLMMNCDAPCSGETGPDPTSGAEYAVRCGSEPSWLAPPTAP